MYLKAVAIVTLFTGFLSAADVFSVRSFHDPKTDARILMSDTLLSGPLVRALPAAKPLKAQTPCAIPLTQAKHQKTNDAITPPAAPGTNPDPGSVVPAPMPACKNWN